MFKGGAARCVAIVITLSVAGCAGGGSGLATKYRPWGLTGGYKEKQLSSNHWRVQAGANGVSTDGAAQHIAVYRAAELVKAAGFSYFQIVNQKGKQSYFGIGGSAPTNSSGSDMMLEIVGTNDPSPPIQCFAKQQTACFTISVEDAIARSKSFLRF